MTRPELLTAYWITFPEDASFPIGMGVTAFDIEDAFRLLEDRGYTFHRRASRVEVRENVRASDLLGLATVMGPIVCRGIWFPCLNVGLGASGPEHI